MKTRTAVSIFSVVLLGSGGFAQQKRPAEVELQAAIRTETVAGDLKSAIKQYQKLIAQYAADRRLVATALLHLGGCYEKLGEAQARGVYERLLHEYADQTQAASAARERLARIEAARRASGMSSRLVWRASGALESTVSHNGRYLPYTDWAEASGQGELFLYDLVAGTTRRITRDVDSFGMQFAEKAAFSPDDSQLAYAWFNKEHFDLRIIGLETTGSSRPRVLFSNPEVPSVVPHDWSPDGKWLAVQLQRKDKTAQIGLVSVEDGALRVLKSVDWRGSRNLFFSPDSKYLAYDLPAGDSTDRHDVFVLALDGSREIPAVVHPSNDILMGWSPDGAYLLFASDRTGSTALWSLRFLDGKPQGTPEQIKADISGNSLGVTSNGTLYTQIHYSHFTGVVRSDIQVAAFDFAKGQFQSTPALAVHAFVGANNFPAWSPDGKYLAFLSRRGRTDMVIGILSQENGQLRELRPQLNIYYGGATLRWSPDGHFLAIHATDSKGRQGIFRIDAATGEASAIALSSRKDPMWAPDGKRIYYLRVSRKTAGAVIVERDLSSGNEKEVFRRTQDASWNPHWMFVELSPDGNYLAAVANSAWPGHHTGEWTLLLIPANGGQPKELMLGQSQGAGVLTWVPDSRSILVYSIKDGATGDREVWRVPIDGGKPQKLDLNVNWLGRPFNSDQQLHVHPDGKRVAFAVAEPAKRDEVWVLENFLPALNKLK